MGGLGLGDCDNLRTGPTVRSLLGLTREILVHECFNGVFLDSVFFYLLSSNYKVELIAKVV